MDYPTYKGYIEDMQAMKAAVDEAKAEFDEKAKKDGLKTEESKARYDKIKLGLDEASKALTTLADKESSEEARKTAWYALTKIDLPASPDDAINDSFANGKDEYEKTTYANQVAAFSSLLNNDNERRLYRAQKKLSAALNTISVVECKQNLDDITARTDNYETKAKSWKNMVANFKSNVIYGSVGELNAAKKKLDEEKQKLDKDLAYYSNTKELERLSNLYKEFTDMNNPYSPYKTMHNYERQVSDYSQKIDAVEKEIHEIDEGIRDAKTMDRKKKDALKSLEEQMAAENKLMDESMKQLAQYTTWSAEERSALAIDQNKYDRVMGSVRDALKKGKTGLGDKNTDEMLLRMYDHIDKSVAFDTLYTEMLNELREIDDEGKFGIPQRMYKATNEERNKQFEAMKTGRANATISEKIVNQYRTMNFKPFTAPLDIAKVYDKYMAKFNELYAPDDEEKASIEKNVNCPDDLVNLIVKASKAHLNSAQKLAGGEFNIPDLKDEDKKKITEVLTSKYAAFNKNIVTPERIKSAEAAIKVYEINKNRYDIEVRSSMEKLNRLEQQIKDIKGGKLNSLEALKSEKLLEKKAFEAERNDYDVRAKNFRNLMNTLHNDLEKFKDGLGATKEALAKNEKAQKDLADFSNRANKVHEAYKSMVEAGFKTYTAACEPNTTIDNFDRTLPARRALGSELINFYESRHYIMKPDHHNSDEFNNMVGAVNKLLKKDEGSDCMRYLNWDTVNIKAQIDIIGQRAQEYLEARSHDFVVKASDQRKYRLDYARRLVKFAQSFSATFNGLSENEKAMKEKYAAFKKDYVMNKHGEGTLNDTYADIKNMAIVKKNAELNNNRQSNVNPEANKNLEMGLK